MGDLPVVIYGAHFERFERQIDTRTCLRAHAEVLCTDGEDVVRSVLAGDCDLVDEVVLVPDNDERYVALLVQELDPFYQIGE